MAKRRTKTKPRLRVVSSKPAKSKPALPPRQLYNRQETAYVLHTSISTIRRMEASGKLTPVKLNAELGDTYYPVAQVHAIAAGGAR